MGTKKVKCPLCSNEGMVYCAPYEYYGIVPEETVIRKANPRWDFKFVTCPLCCGTKKVTPEDKIAYVLLTQKEDDDYFAHYEDLVALRKGRKT